ncbi:unnamed protein product [Colias eurytheme]|nr:unnamed protein product [Colias eurytheme]
MFLMLQVKLKYSKQTDSIDSRRNFDDFDLDTWQPLDAKYGNTRRIFNGRRTSIDDYPFIASVHVKGQFTCSGSIISKRVILSAATCLQAIYNSGLDGTKFVKVRIGSDFVNKYGNFLPISAIDFHPQYDPIYLRHNLVVLIIDKLNFRRNWNIKRIKIDKDDTSIEGDVTLLGWGAHDVRKIEF